MLGSVPGAAWHFDVHLLKLVGDFSVSTGQTVVESNRQIRPIASVLTVRHDISLIISVVLTWNLSEKHWTLVGKIVHREKARGLSTGLLLQPEKCSLTNGRLAISDQRRKRDSTNARTLPMNNRPEWRTKTGFLLAALGSAIGLGNIWRFPYIAYRNGGGAFLVPYLVALFIVGVPLLMLEFGLGHHFRRAFPQALGRVHARFSWIGWWSVSFVMFGIVAYYGVVIAWCACYLVFSITQPWGELAAVNGFFDETFLGAFDNGEPFAIYTAESGFRLGDFQGWIVIALACVWAVNWVITRRELQRGVELANRIFIPALVVITLVLVFWSWGFDGAGAGRELYLRPDWSRVFEATDLDRRV